ncbi:FMN-binding negative transcriptional regulator [Alteromonas pelagimontana]|uniref:FMN-binding negative transcriptional regulator n=1 Tax=Alteromonas pelagimontana TaxID=1858656 RepID=A0A6M4MFW2_9ALTE|nr:FMN-binding negative transcriptional regulator [Alteromonas pelagimontana]QJR81505.1 FMN-binding negative transcriptional regulator [Alteromonas pelagimontana]
MYAPVPYYTNDENIAVELINDIVMGTLVARDKEMTASPLPFQVLKRDNGQFILESHFDRRNPLGEVLRKHSDVKVIFWGPNSYISPSQYLTSPRVPTWIFTTLHIEGKVTFLDEPEGASDVVTTLSRHLEPQTSGWDIDQVEDYKQKLVSGIKGFHLKVTRCEAQLRLAQQGSKEELQHLVETLAAQSPVHGHGNIVQAIKKYVLK